MNPVVKSILRFLLFAGIGMTILWLIYSSINASYLAECAQKGIPESECSLLKKLWEDFASASLFWLFIVLICFMLSNISRALRWQMLLKPLGYTIGFWNSFLTIMLGYFANLGLPRMGEFVRAGALSRNEDIPFEQVMGTIVTDRLFDFICLGIMIVLGLLLNFQAIWQFIESSPLVGLLDYWYILAIIAVAGLAFLWWLVQWVRNSETEEGLAGRIKKIATGFAEGILSVRKVSNIPLFLFHTGFIWLMYYTMTYLCFFAYEPTSHLPPAAGLIVFDLGAIGMVVPSPGGMGTYHYMLMSGLKLFGVDEVSGFSFANILFFSIQIFCNIAFGLIALITLPYLRRSRD